MFYTHGLSSRGKQLMRVDEEGSVAADGPSSPPAASGPGGEHDDAASVWRSVRESVPGCSSRYLWSGQGQRRAPATTSVKPKVAP